MINPTKTNPLNQNIELGKIAWYRDYDQALAESTRLNKPIFLFFQEIPGCSTCVNFGRDVLTHPLMVETIENEFIPLAIHNNKSGKDAAILAKYNEPAWNNPVVHFVNSKGEAIISKLTNNYDPLSMYSKIVEVLLMTKGTIPEYVKLLGNDLKIDFNYSKKTIYETPCFWSGETTMAQHKAVYTTLPGFIGNREVVAIDFDTNMTSLKEMDDYAKEQGFFLINNHSAFKVDKDPQYYLKKTNYKFLPLSKTQRSKINLAIPYKINPEQYLSPKQLYWLYHKDLNSLSHPKAYELDIAQSWDFLNNEIK